MKKSILAVGFCAVAIFALGRLAAVEQSGSGWSPVKGRIVWSGASIPERKPVNLGANANAAQCMRMGKPPLSEEWVVDPKSKGIRWAFVWIQADKGVKLPIHPDLQEIKRSTESMDQPWCMFEPHALALREGQTLLAKNSSTIAHNYRGYGNPSSNAGFNLLIPPGGTREIKELKSDRLPIIIQDDVHPWMRAYVRVFDHPYYAVTDERGAFELSNVPAGRWNLVVWHGTGGWRGGAAGKDGTPITVKAGAITELGDLSFSAT